MLPCEPGTLISSDRRDLELFTRSPSGEESSLERFLTFFWRIYLQKNTPALPLAKEGSWIVLAKKGILIRREEGRL